jgi:hypothetical protein
MPGEQVDLAGAAWRRLGAVPMPDSFCHCDVAADFSASVNHAGKKREEP